MSRNTNDLTEMKSPHTEDGRSRSPGWISKRLHIHKKKLGWTLGTVAIGWLLYRCFFPFGILQEAQQATINEIFATAEITHIRIAYACGGNETPVGRRSQFETLAS